MAAEKEKWKWWLLPLVPPLLVLQFLMGLVFRRLMHLDRLEALDAVPLRAPLQAVIDEWDEPRETEATDALGRTRYLFAPGPYHTAEVTVWQGVVHRIWYTSQYASPERDLRWALETYGEGVPWRELASGYSSLRQDEDRLLTYSVMPWITVSTRELVRAEQQAKEAAAASASD